MSASESIEHNGSVYARFFQADIPAKEGVHFVSEDSDPLQVGVFERHTGYEVAAHRHTGREMHLESVGEFLWIQSGSASVTVFDEEWNVLKEKIVKSGDCVLLLRGGHALTMLEPTRILEVKQGPYPGRDAEKVFRDSA